MEIRIRIFNSFALQRVGVFVMLIVGSFSRFGPFLGSGWVRLRRDAEPVN